MSDMLAAWKAWRPPASGDLMLPQDSAAFELLDRSPGLARYDSWEECHQSFDPWTGGKQLHPRLVPLPFMGDVANACVVLLLLNPGLSATDYFAEMQVAGFRERLLANLQQDFTREEYPFFALDPKLAWHSGNRYWERKFGDVVKSLATEWHISNNAVRSRIAKRICAVELLPYHSCSFSIPSRARKAMHSMKLAVDDVKQVLQPRADAGHCLIVAMRSVRDWELEADGEQIIGFTASQARGAHLSLADESSAGSMVVQMLLRDHEHRASASALN
jgi:hypothetical protein